ncbi:TetR/AcrR family transcriptional regulator [Labedella populi]|uniref:TetR/AcrR family transcriptional regulator n=1 Tax=Labedella populi TaxID=2498850 RepID=A0A3S4DSN1_9MICO|nr:TetR/AcrR family transcriptional regulator [Labedella populi]RWZ58272.1 TetR/AcrR family transcriptional regulator [Labedella populi]
MTLPDPRLARTRHALIAAATAALDDRGTEFINITDLVATAGVSRPSFYQHFGDLPTLVHAAALARVREAFESIATPDNIGESWTSFTQRTVRELIAHFAEHSDFYLRAVQGPAGQIFAASVIRFLSERLETVSPLAPVISDSLLPHELADFLAAGVFWTITSWLGTDPSDRASVDEMTRRVGVLLLSSTGSSPEDVDAALRTSTMPGATSR